MPIIQDFMPIIQFALDPHCSGHTLAMDFILAQ